MHRHLLYRLQYQKKLWGILKKFWQKNVFPQKYDEIRRLDGTIHDQPFFTEHYLSSDILFFSNPRRELRAHTEKIKNSEHNNTYCIAKLSCMSLSLDSKLATYNKENEKNVIIEVCGVGGPLHRNT
jgi:hypothetical protein